MEPAPTLSRSHVGVFVGVLLIGIVGGSGARIIWGRPAPQPPAFTGAPSQQRELTGSQDDHFDVGTALALGSTSSLPVFFREIQTASASASRIAEIAAALLAQARHARDDTLWALILARWSQVDPSAMMAFAESHAGDTCATLPAMAWKAWGATRPEAAFAAAKSQPEPLRKAMLQGVAAVDPAKAAHFALGLPNAQFAIGTVIRDLARHDPDAALALLPSAVYDGAREPIHRAVVEQLAQSDPDQALALVRQAGRIWDDREAETFAAIARHHPEKACELIEAIPSSRSKALSSVSVAKTIAADDQEAALEWTRTSLKGPVRDAALVEIASVTGGSDPVAGLALLAEVGWRETGDLYLTQERQRADMFGVAATSDVATRLLRQWAATDPDGARTWLEAHAPATLQAAIATAGGLTP
jgi:hypothetical protein